jgi:hypothetical protein
MSVVAVFRQSYYLVSSSSEKNRSNDLFVSIALSRYIQRARAVQVQVLPVTSNCRQPVLLEQLLHQEPRESSSTLVRPSLHRALPRLIGQLGLGLGVATAPRGHEIECRLLGFARSFGDDRFKGAQGLSSRFASECRRTTWPHRQALSGQYVSGWSSPQDFIQVPRTHGRNQGSSCTLPWLQEHRVSALGCREVGFIGKHGQNPKLVSNAEGKKN